MQRYTSRLLPKIALAGGWFLRSGIQESTGGVARYYLVDQGRNLPVSTEITGYAASALSYLHSLDPTGPWLEAADAAARYLADTAWDASGAVMPFEVHPPRFAYFFDSGIIVRGLLAVWRAGGRQRYLDVATAIGRSMQHDFAAPDGSFHPVLELPSKRPVEREPLRWSRDAGCYQLKAAMAWWDLAEATGDSSFGASYDRVLEASLRTSAGFLPGHPDPAKVMDRLHAFAYFVEGLLPRASEPCVASALCSGIARLGEFVRRLGSDFVRSDVYAQLLRVRLYAQAAGVPLDRSAAAEEASGLAAFQADSIDPRLHGGFYFGRKGGEWLPYVNPVSTAFALQALAAFEASAPPRQLLI